MSFSPSVPTMPSQTQPQRQPAASRIAMAPCRAREVWLDANGRLDHAFTPGAPGP